MSVKYSKELLEPLVRDSISIAQVIRKLGLKQSGGNHSHITSKIKKYEISTDHFRGAATNYGPGHLPPKLSPDQILVNDRFQGRRDSAKILRRALLESGIEHKCAVCGLGSEWNGRYLQLQIDHINGIITDNRIENLRFICGNCHLQTETFGIKNSPRYFSKVDVYTTVKVSKIKKAKPSEFNPNWRNTPRPDARKVNRPSKEELEKLLWERPTSQLAIEFGVSDKAIEKWAKSYGITKPPRGYWAKVNKN